MQRREIGVEQIAYEDVVRKWKERDIHTISQLDTALSDYRILFAYHSNRIENAGVSLHETREIFENGKVINYTGDLRPLFETENQKICYDFLKENIIGRAPVTEQLICETHERLCHGCYDEARWTEGERPGTYKKHFYGVGPDVGVSPEDVAFEMKDLCRQLADAFEQKEFIPEEQILTAASWFHCNFESIHPFADGNGRVGRTMLNYILLTHGLPPVILYEEDKKLYYEALAAFDHTEKLDGFNLFIKEQTVKTWTRTDRKGRNFIAI